MVFGIEHMKNGGKKTFTRQKWRQRLVASHNQFHWWENLLLKISDASFLFSLLSWFLPVLRIFLLYWRHEKKCGCMAAAN